MCENKCFFNSFDCLNEECFYYWHYCLKCCCYDNGCKADIDYIVNACRVAEAITDEFSLLGG